MKKLLSITLAVAMIMSLFCVVPASAVDYADFELPYGFADFEDGKTIFSAGNNPVYLSEVVDSGVPARGKVAQVTVQGGTNGGPSMLANVGGVTSGLKTPLSIGDEITISMWIKSNVVLNSANFSIIMTSMSSAITGGTLNGNGYHSWVVPFDKNSTDWQYVTKTFTSTFSTDETTAFSYRFGTTGGLNFVPGENDKSETITDRVYQIDDFEIKIERRKSKATSYPIEGRNIFKGDAESADGIVVANGSVEPVTPIEGAAIVATDGDKYLKATGSNNNPTLKLQLAEPMKAGHMYILTYDTMAADYDPTAITSTTKYNTQHTVPIKDWDNTYYTRDYLNQSYEEQANAGVWQSRRIPISVDVDSTGYGRHTYAGKSEIWIQSWLGGQTTPTAASHLYDNIKVVDLGPMSNGGNEESPASSSIMNGAQGFVTSTTNYTNLAFGWRVDGVTGTDYALHRSDSSYRSGKYMFNWSQLSENAKLYQPLGLDNGGKYKLSFWIRRGGSSNSLVGTDSIYENKVRVKLDRSGWYTAPVEATDGVEAVDGVRYAPTEIYDVSGDDGDFIEYGDWMTITKNGAYVKYEMEIDNTFPLIEGMTETADVFPRQPIMSLEFSSTYENAFNKEVREAEGIGSFNVYIDDFVIEQLNDEGYPTVVANSAAMNVNGNVTVDYTYTTEGDVAEATDVSVYKLVADGRYYGTFYDKDAIVVPEEAREVEGLSLEIVPVSATGYYGDAVTVAIEKIAAPEPDPIVGTTISVTEGGITVATETALTGAKLIFVNYDANGKMITFDWSTVVTLDAQGTEEYPIPSGFEDAKVMLWQIDAATEICKPLANVIE